MMRVVHRDAVEQNAAGQNRVPHLLEPGRSSTADVVHLRVSVEDLEQPVVPDARELVGADRPAEVRMIDVRDAVRCADRVDIPLYRFQDAVPALRWHERIEIQPVDVDRLRLEAVGNLLATDHQKALVRSKKRIQSVHAVENVVIRQHQELIAVFAVPAHHLVRGRIAVGAERMGVGVSLEPSRLRLRRRPGLEPGGADFERGHENDERGRTGGDAKQGHVSQMATNARTGKVPNPLTFTGTAVSRPPWSGTSPRPRMCSQIGMSRPSRMLCTGRSPVSMLSMLKESMPTSTAPAFSSHSAARAVRCGWRSK